MSGFCFYVTELAARFADVERTMSISSHSIDETRIPIKRRQGTDFKMVGDGAAMQRLRKQVERFGPHFRTLLLSGENGTGKELTARALHASSQGMDEAFVMCRAATLDHEVERQLGILMRRAGRGTLFFDAVEGMPLDAQDRLLWVMKKKMHTRIIASCNQDLRILSASGHFRRELYHRLAMVEIVLEPLRNRAEDIPALALHFLKQSSLLCEKSVTMIAQDAMEHLTKHSWPGNVQEMEDSIRNGVLACGGNILRARHLVPTIERNNVTAIRGASERGASESMRLQDVIERHVLHVLKGCAGNKLRAAEQLGISRSTLYRMLDGGTGAERWS